MYCSECGVAATAGVAYCQRCGAKLATTQALTNAPVPERLFEVIKTLVVMATLFGVIGTGAAAWAIVTMARLGLSPEAIAILGFFLLLTIGGGLFLFMRQVSRTLDVYLPGGGQEAASPQLKPAQPPQLEAAHTPFISVVEHTTRSLDAIPRETRN